MIELTNEEKNKIENIWTKFADKMSVITDKTGEKIPYTTVNGVHDDKYAENPAAWTNGFWPALMVLMYDATKEEKYLKTARLAMDKMDSVLFNYDVLHHDVGFMWNISSGADYRLTGDKKQRNRFLLAANHLMGRYNADGGFIRAWNDGDEDVRGWAIIDCMMNIPILYRASEETKDDRFKMVAIRHADKTMKYHIRADGSCNHIVEYDPIDGGFIRSIPGQGYKDNPLSSWSRGQAWGLYGFALSYFHTKNQDYLDAAKRIAHYFIANVAQSGWVPKCDFRSPSEPVIYDTTAAVCAICGLIEIAENVDSFEERLYIDAALSILNTITEKFCDFSNEEESVLQMGTEAYYIGKRHLPIIYGDFFYAEALHKLRGFKNIIW